MESSMESSKLGLRKGAWTKGEDDLLRQCIENHGEGKWHQVPYKAGLNRCRKSCRLRWLNYLKPNIRRGDFTEDEVDLMLRLHKLLGNRWSLIAGRLPGRTANDVKNYWNTRVRINSRMKNMTDRSQETTKTVVIRPQPRSFFKISSSLRGKEPTSENTRHEENFSTPLQRSSSTVSGNDWWESLLDDNDSGETTTCYCPWLEEEILTSSWFDGMQHSATTCAEEGLSTKSDFSFNVDLWNHSKE